MSAGAICRCVHGCRQYAVQNGYCPACLSGWHSRACPELTELRNPRLQGVPLRVGETAYCGTCGAQPGQHVGPL